MQIATVHKLQSAVDMFLKACKFVWRHAFVAAAIITTISSVTTGKTPVVPGEIIFYLVAATLDWIKNNLNFSNKGNYTGISSSPSFSEQNYWNSSVVGSPAYLSSIGTSSNYYN